MPSSSAGGGTDTNTTYLPLSDPRCNDFVCLAFKAAGDASQGEIPFASQFVYGHYAVCYYSAFVIFFSILYLHRRLSAAFVEYPEPNTTVPQKSKALWRFIKYKKLGFGISLGHTMMIGLAILFMTVLTFVPRPYFRPRLSYGSPPLGLRTGVMALALTPAVVALSGKYSLITLVTGISYERLNILHRHLSYVCLGLGLVHTVAVAIAIYGDSNYWPLLEKIGSAEYTGVIVLIGLLFLTIFSIPWFRQRFYEAFASSHIFFYFLYLGFLFWHTANRIDTWMYLYTTVAMSLFSNLGRLLLKFKTPRWSGSTATIQDIDGEMLRITIPAFNGMNWKPGQHVYLRFPSVSPLENHPFTIVSLCEETFVTDKSGISTRTPLLFLVKAKKGLTKRLMKIAQQRTTLKAFIDGPYGGNHLNFRSGYEQVILIAGGSGISAVLPLFLVLCKNMTKMDSTLKSVRLIWVIKNRRAQAWVQEELRAALAITVPGTAEISLFITGERNRVEQLAFSFGADDIELEAGFENGRKVSEEVDLEEERLIPGSDGILDPQDQDLNKFVSLDDLEMELGMGDVTSEHDVDVDDNEEEKLVQRHQMDGQHENPDPYCDYGIKACISHGRPYFQDVLPRLLLGGGRICVIGEFRFPNRIYLFLLIFLGCGPQDMNIDLSNAVAACQTRVLSGQVREISLWTEAFGW
ncbi:FAD-binding domain-containing protein [Rhexocercosporidium sp. MPI-PUGE-AT-0058]|nr:FAD-binding domain-containing protein [Rhexocercosporidium sp. MPI-PUGE-AT-0058]